MLMFRHKKKKPDVTQHMLFNANNRTYMKFLSEAKRKALIDFEKEFTPGACFCCIFYYHVYDDKGFVKHGGCTLNDDIVIDSCEIPEQCELKEKAGE